MKNSRREEHRFGQVAFYPPSSWPSIKKKTLSPAPYAPPRLKHSRATRELVCRLCAPPSLRSLSTPTNDPFSLLVSRESRNEAPSIVRLIFRNFSKKKKKRKERNLSHVTS